MQVFSSNVARLLPHSLSAGASVAVLLAIWSAGCDGAPLESVCCELAPVCPEGSKEVGTCETAACTSVSACCTTVLCEPETVCTPLCPPGEAQVESCED